MANRPTAHTSSVDESGHMRIRTTALLIGLLLIALAGPGASSAQGQDVVIFQDAFDSGSADGWQLDAGWQVEKDADNYVLSGEGHKWARLATRYAWSDFRLRVRVKLIAGDIHLNYRISDCIRYFIGFSPRGVSLSKTMPCGTHTGLASNPGNYPLNQWHTVEIVSTGGNIKVLVNDTQRIDYTDPNPLLTGSIAFETLENSHTHLDDVTVIGSAPTPTPTPLKGYTWIRTGGPLGGLGYDVRMRPDNPDVMYVTDAWAGVHKSTDGGRTWFPANNGITTRTGISGDAIPTLIPLHI